MNEFLTVSNISKVYEDGVVANSNISFSVNKGEMHAICGENGAGKSTLMKMLYGMVKPSEGDIFFKGKRVDFENPKQAIASGIGMVHQEFMLIPSFTVAENITLGADLLDGVFLDKKEAIKVSNDLSKKYNLDIDSEATVESIPVGMRQRVEILKALYRGADLLILDEPTAVLTPQESEELFCSLRKLTKEQGKSIIFITHKLKEVSYASDRITVIQHGRVTGGFNTSEVTEVQIAEKMVGREILQEYKLPDTEKGKVLLDINNLTFHDEAGICRLNNLNMNICQGEILGIAGVEGNGQTELAKVITGLIHPSSGTIKMQGENIENLDPRTIRNKGIAHVSEDRKGDGTAGNASIKDNIIVDRFYKPTFSKWGLLRNKTIENHVSALIERFDIRCSSLRAKTGSLSGGNMQKVVIAREISAKPDVLIAAQPTRGVDIGASELIRTELVKLRNSGKAVMLISADLDEILSISDRVAVLYKGELVAILDNHDLDEKTLGLYMLGLKRESTDAR
ncbi:ABC transporter ATP-binding protein [Vibrio mediterranei]|uniref:ABC transporter ATP-binding protein n=1 Tax=Vibrio mediterranei TaxID=689 RepID=UPI001EFC83DB|nr:ABC transporter ATP-binding protein [Vibrio mediterranei]MCG9627468.1 ABC transporter ATP-binding protein [Vibrio mediterranei]